jgi:protein-tyrosine phosphatase
VLTASPRHRSAVLEEFPEMLGATFALREYARLCSAVDRAMLSPDLVKRARSLVDAARAQRGMVDLDGDDRIPDPIGRDRTAFENTVGMTFRSIVDVLNVLAPRPAAGG